MMRKKRSEINNLAVLKKICLTICTESSLRKYYLVIVNPSVPGPSSLGLVRIEVQEVEQTETETEKKDKEKVAKAE